MTHVGPQGHRDRKYRMRGRWHTDGRSGWGTGLRGLTRREEERGRRAATFFHGTSCLPVRCMKTGFPPGGAGTRRRCAKVGLCRARALGMSSDLHGPFSRSPAPLQLPVLDPTLGAVSLLPSCHLLN